MPSDPNDDPSRLTGRPTHFMTYPYPDTERVTNHIESLSGVKPDTKRCIANLLQYRAARTRARLPRGQSAAVLVPLFVGRSGDLYVLLSRRSDALRAFAGDTALPGGKIDAQDVTVEDTARREAFEEVGLPMDEERVPLLCVLEPHLAKGAMLVTPVVVLILDNSLQPTLNASEVTSIFAQPLSSFLSSSTPHLSTGRTADLKNPFPYHSFEDVPWSGGVIRLHRFLTGRESQGVKPVFGVTASILIRTATIGYGRPPDFEVQPPNAPTPAQQIARALLTPANPLRAACEREGVGAEEAAARLLHPSASVTEWEEIEAEWKRRLGGGDAVGRGKSKGSDWGSCERRARWDRTPGGEGVQKHDETRNVVKEVEGDEKRLAEADPKVVEQFRKQPDEARNEDGVFDPKVVFAMIPKEGLNNGKEGIDMDGGEGREQGTERMEGTQRGWEEMRKYAGEGVDGHGPERAVRKKRDSKL